MVGLHKDPKGENIFSKSSIGTPNNTSLNMTAATKKSMKASEVDTLRHRIKELESELQKKVNNISLPPSTVVSHVFLHSFIVGKEIDKSYCSSRSQVEIRVHCWSTRGFQHGECRAEEGENFQWNYLGYSWGAQWIGKEWISCWEQYSNVVAS